MMGTDSAAIMQHGIGDILEDRQLDVTVTATFVDQQDYIRRHVARRSDRRSMKA